LRLSDSFRQSGARLKVEFAKGV